MKKKGILFDLDGTLWDSSVQVIAAWNACLATQTTLPNRYTVAQMQSYMGKTLEVIANLMFPELPAAEQIRIMKLCTAAEHSYLATHPAVLYPQEEAVLSALHEHFLLGVVSNCQDGYIQCYLQQTGFSHLFADFECAGRTGCGKGSNIRETARRNGLTDCIYVGDTQGDADAAAEAGVKFVHAAYGFGTVTHADGVLTSLSALPAMAHTLLG